MKNRWILNLLLAALIGALALVAIYKPGKKEDQQAIPLTTLERDAIGRIQVERPQGKALVLEKGERGWRLAQPLKARANRFNVDSLLRLAQAETEGRFPADAKALKQYGLDPPEARVRFDEEEVGIGASHPLKPLRYVLHKGQVHLVPAQRTRSAFNPYTDFISSRLFAAQSRLKRIELPKQTLSLKDGAWQLKPEIEDLGTDAINDFVDEWRHARALSVGKYSGKRPRAHVKVVYTGPEGKEHKLRLGILQYRPDFILYRPDEGLEYRFTEDTGKRLLELKALEKSSK